MILRGSCTRHGSPPEEVFADRLKFEHDLISQRMTWLMALDGFLLGAAALLIVNEGTVGAPQPLAGFLSLITTLGALSNASCLFSNFWAGRAIRGAGAALDETWRRSVPRERQRRVAAMRLHGRDPRSFVGPPAALPTQILHPWNLLPAAFLSFFLGAAVFLLISDTNPRDASSWGSVASLLVVPFFAERMIRDVRVHSERMVVAEYLRGQGAVSWPSRRRARQIHRERLADVRRWLSQKPPSERTGLPGRYALAWWGAISPELHERYLRDRGKDAEPSPAPQRRTSGRSSRGEESAFFLAEYSALRSEIDRRSTSQQAILALQITVSAGAAGLAVRGEHTPWVLLVLPFFSLALFWLYVDNHLQVSSIGAYTSQVWEARLRGVRTWENSPREGGVGERLDRKQWRAAVVLIYLGSSAGGLLWAGQIIFAASVRERRSEVVLWALAALAIAIMVPEAARFVRPRRPPASSG